MKKKSVIVLVSVAILFLFVLCQVVSATPWTPVEWKENGRMQDWIRDRNHDYVDDLIDGERGPVTIIVDLNQCVGNIEESEIVRFLETVGNIEYIGKFLSFIIVSEVDVADVPRIASRPEVAMVELAVRGSWTGVNFQAAKIQTSMEYSGQNLQDMFGWSSVVNGDGVIIAFADTGVSHEAEAEYAISVAGGYDGFTGTVGNPEPTVTAEGYYHADDMSSWVFSPGAISPGARLFDIKIGTMDDDVDPAAEARAFEAIYGQNDVWNINILTLMYSLEITDGKEARSQLLNLLVSKGIVIVAGSGDNTAGSSVTYPGVASQVIAVSAADVKGTIDRDNDEPAFVVGPVTGGAAGRLESLKPELIIPTGEEDTPVSNSIATAQAAGLTALILQSNLGFMNPENRAVGSVKDLLLRTAEEKGIPDTGIIYPQVSPSWNRSWGFGEVDAFETFNYRMPGQAELTDLTFLGFDGSSPPYDPYYYSYAIETQSERNGINIQSDVPDRIFARVYNNGTHTARSIRVNFGFYPFTAGIPTFYDIGSQIIPELESGDNTVVSMDWVPPDMPDGEDHGCLFLSIDYGFDNRFSEGSNFAQKNVRVSNTGSPALFTFRVENTLPSRARIHLDVTPKDTGWGVSLSDNDFEMDPEDCARSITVKTSPPGGINPGTETLFFITAYATAQGTDKPVDIGGVALKARVVPVTPTGSPFILLIPIALVISVLWYRSRHKSRPGRRGKGV